MAVLTIQPDPTAGKDTVIDNNGFTGDYGSRNDFQAGNAVSAGKEWRSILQLDFSVIPLGTVISSAILSLYCWSRQAANTTTIRIHRGLTDWFEGPGNGSTPGAGVNASVWNFKNYNGSVAWPGGAGGGSGSSWVTTATASASVTNTGVWYTWDVTADVQGFVNGTFTNFGWWVIASTLTTNNRKFFYSSDEVTNLTLRPKIDLTYVLPQPSPVFSIGNVVSPTVAVDTGVQPAALSAVAAISGPAIIVTSELQPEAAESIGGVVEPSVVKGSVVLTPEPAGAAPYQAIGEVLKGSVVLEAQAVSIGATTLEPLSGSGQVAEPNATDAVGETVVTAVKGPVLVIPTPANVSVSTQGEGVKGSVLISPFVVQAVAEVVRGTVLSGAPTLVPEPAQTIGGTFGPNILIPASSVSLRDRSFKGMERAKLKGMR